jgi:hypothetical protein
MIFLVSFPELFIMFVHEEFWTYEISFQTNIIKQAMIKNTNE